MSAKLLHHHVTIKTEKSVYTLHTDGDRHFKMFKRPNKNTLIISRTELTELINELYTYTIISYYYVISNKYKAWV